MKKLLEIKNLEVCFYLDSAIPAVDGVSFDVYEGETLCVVGESGCGKSVTSLSIMQLVATPPGRYLNGEILYRGKNLLGYSTDEMTKIRGKEISMIFQEPMTALNPVHRVGKQIGEALRIHEGYDKKEAFKESIEMLKIVGVPDPVRCANSFPYQLSGGMRQRVMIAMAISCNPNMLIADEPTTALDVTIQQQILDVIKNLKTKTGMTVMFITHDLGVVAEIADRVVVMYAGKVVEEACVKDLFANPLHPYTRALLKCIPRVDEKRDKLDDIKGIVPNPASFPSGCRFHPRCEEAIKICKTIVPEEVTLGDRRVSCHLVTQKAKECRL
ncbi:ABC transporter ATP-binding protein [Paratissierella segnis]|uniref:ABC transporter ATP-binding protein n=1 Tax=Paratissierella segnis TaxID=2763679 RepID=A0A926EW80_9FIRM|nr:ABC transporter ATP-binding protein [Paratissierella segnis]MBC8587439.1 ABC transporter ATP-binding protein [Paratissierella segnis]